MDFLEVYVEVVHGIPSHRKLKEGDIVKLDIGACYQGYHGDSAWSYIVGNPKSPRDVKLLKETEEALMAGLEAIHDGCTTGDIGHAVSKVAKKYNLSPDVLYVRIHRIRRRLADNLNNIV